MNSKGAETQIFATWRLFSQGGWRTSKPFAATVRKGRFLQIAGANGALIPRNFLTKVHEHFTKFDEQFTKFGEHFTNFHENTSRYHQTAPNYTEISRNFT